MKACCYTHNLRSPSRGVGSPRQWSVLHASRKDDGALASELPTFELEATERRGRSSHKKSEPVRVRFGKPLCRTAPGAFPQSGMEGAYAFAAAGAFVRFSRTFTATAALPVRLRK